MKRFLLIFFAFLSVSLIYGQSKEELQARLAEKNDSIKALQTKADAIQAEIDAIPGWRLRATGTIGGSI